jgi:dihydrolipoamide dehydrogenase
MTTTDLIIIGSGPGGYRAAAYAAEAGLAVTIIEQGEVGGTCLNCGCIPTKTLCRHAEILETLRKADTFGLSDLSYTLDYNRVMDRKRQVVDSLRQGVETLLSAPGITLVRGKAHFTGPKTVAVGEEEYTASHIIIATGSHAKRLPVPGIDDPRVVTSTQLLEKTSIPRRLCIVGAGVIGMEFASIFSSFGSEVTVVEFLKECLPAIDSDIAKRLRQSIARRGVTFLMQSAVKAITSEGVVYERKGKEGTVEADTILIATGRAASTEGLDLEKAGVETSRIGITVDADLRTTAEGIYAIGDVNGITMLAHAATAQGLHVVNQILGREDSIRLHLIPAAIFTLPEAASVGLTEEVCKAEVSGYRCLKGYYRANGKALAMDESEGMVKVLVDADGHLIGCHVYGAHAADLVQEASSLMAMGATIDQLRDIVHIHPTLSEILAEVR